MDACASTANKFGCTGNWSTFQKPGHVTTCGASLPVVSMSSPLLFMEADNAEAVGKVNKGKVQSRASVSSSTHCPFCILFSLAGDQSPIRGDFVSVLLQER